MDKVWLQAYPDGVPHAIDPDQYTSLLDLIDAGVAAHQAQAAYTQADQTLSFERLGECSRDLAAYLQGLGLQRGERVAVMLPNVLQYPIAVLAILRAGLVVVNVNPLYTARELTHQLADSGARAIIVLDTLVPTLQACLAQTQVQHLVWTGIDDLLSADDPLMPELPLPLPLAQGFKTALACGARQPWQRPQLQSGDLAALQYTGGTTGVSKGAMLTHRNIIANVLQATAWNDALWQEVKRTEQPVVIGALPLYHIYGFTACMMVNLRLGACCVLIPNPRDLDALIQQLARQRFHSFPGVNTLFHALLQHPDFERVDWRAMRMTVGGGMAVQAATAQLWQDKTGRTICQGYGLSETSPTVSCNIASSQEFTGSVGLPLPSTEVAILDDAGLALPCGGVGEVAVRGPQVMAGYWQRGAATAQVMTPDGYFRTGDIGVMNERGYLSLVDRKKDMIVVSGFNVYPSELEDVMTQMPGVLEAAAVGVPDARSGEAVKLIVVRHPLHQPAISEAEVRAWCALHLAGYKRPRVVEFRAELPKSAVGKILRRELRAS